MPGNQSSSNVASRQTKELDMEEYSPGDPSVNYWLRPEQQANLFNKLLQALYLRPYTLFGVEELVQLLELADYYCMLRILSRTLDEALANSQKITREIREARTACHLLPAAAKLRHRKLFSDCILLSLGPWSTPEYSVISNNRFREVAETVRNRISVKIAKSLETIISAYTAPGLHLSLSSYENINDRIIRDLRSTGERLRSKYNQEKVSLPLYFKALSVMAYGNPPVTIFRSACSEMLVNKLFLSPHLSIDRAGIEENFLCDTVKEEEVPWDVNETDW
jgi:hypothetical protein